MLCDRILEDTDPGLAEREGLKLYRGAPFTGVLRGRFSDGQVSYRCRYSQGQLDGWAYTWYPNGLPASARFFQHGQKEGLHEGWWPDGKPRFRYHFHHDLQEGLCQEWYPTGKPYRAQHLEQGREVGLQTQWQPDGRLHSNYQMIAGKRYGLFNTRACEGKRVAQ